MNSEMAPPVLGIQDCLGFPYMLGRIQIVLSECVLPFNVKYSAFLQRSSDKYGIAFCLFQCPKVVGRLQFCPM